MSAERMDMLMPTMSGLRRDYIASNLRSQLNTLTSVIDTLENAGWNEKEYADESLKRIEQDIRRIRRFYKNRI